MSIERYYNEAIVKPTANGYGSMVKAYVETLLEVDDGVFTLAQTDSDTSSNYSAWLRVYDTNIYLYIYSSSSNLKVEWWRDINGQKLHSTQVSSILTNGTPYSIRVTVSKMGDFGVTVTFGSSYTNNGCIAGFAKFVADIDGQEYNHVFAVGTNNGIGLTQHDCYSPFYSGVSVRVSDNFAVSYTTAGNQKLSDAELYLSTKSPYFLVPHGTILYNTNGYWLGHVKWGGKYDIYQLRGNEGIYKTVPTANYVVDGVTYKAAFSELLIPVECA